jgi:hypothetical protein
MEEGQAAGVAAVLSLRARMSLPKFSQAPALVHELQETLTSAAQGAYLLPETVAAASGSVPSTGTNPSHGTMTSGSAPSHSAPHSAAPPSK